MDSNQSNFFQLHKNSENSNTCVKMKQNGDGEVDKEKKKESILFIPMFSRA